MAVETVIPWATIFVGFVAALFAVLSYRAILEQLNVANKQIGLANDQLERADKQIKLAQDQLVLAERQLAVAETEIDLVGRDLAITSRQAELADAERSKRPELSVVFDNATKSTVVRGRQKSTDPQTFYVNFRCQNAGSLAGSEITVALFIPKTISVYKDSSPFGIVSTPIKEPADKMRFAKDSEELPDYRTDTRDVSGLLLPGLTGYVGYAHLVAPIGEYTLRWRVWSLQGVFPKGESTGEIHLRVESRYDEDQAALERLPK